MKNKSITWNARVKQTNPKGETEIYETQVTSTTRERATKRLLDEYAYSYDVWPDGRLVTFQEHLKIELKDHKRLGITLKWIPAEVLSLEPAQ